MDEKHMIQIVNILDSSIDTSNLTYQELETISDRLIDQHNDNVRKTKTFESYYKGDI